MYSNKKRYLYLSAISFENLQKNNNFIGRTVSRIFNVTIYIDLYENQAFIVDSIRYNDTLFLTRLTNFIQKIEVPKKCIRKKKQNVVRHN